MKDSGVEWIGEIPRDWEVVRNKRVMSKVKEICSSYSGEDVLSLTMNGVIVRDLENPYGKMPLTFDGYQFLQQNNLLMCLFDIDVTPRCIGIINNQGVTSPAYTQFRLEKNACTKYYYYYYLNLDFTKEMLHLAKNLRHSLTDSQLGEICVPLPPLETQHRIADYLDRKCSRIDEIIEKEGQVIEKLKAYKLSIITEAVTKGLNPNVPMKDSGVEWIREIPEGWKVVKIKNVSSMVTDGAHVSPETENGLYDFISTVNIEQDNIIFDNCLKTSGSSYKMLVASGCKPQIDDVLISKDGTVGRTVIVKENRDFVISSSLVIIRPLCNVVFPKYLNYNLQSSIVQENLKMIMHGAGLRRVSVRKNANLPVILPNITQQKAIADYLDLKCTQIDETITKKQSIIEKLTAYKKSLIYEVVTGKKEV